MGGQRLGTRIMEENDDIADTEKWDSPGDGSLWQSTGKGGAARIPRTVRADVQGSRRDLAS